jgi:hypothetical protein
VLVVATAHRARRVCRNRAIVECIDGRPAPAARHGADDGRPADATPEIPEVFSVMVLRERPHGRRLTPYEKIGVTRDEIVARPQMSLQSLVEETTLLVKRHVGLYDHPRWTLAPRPLRRPRRERECNRSRPLEA